MRRPRPQGGFTLVEVMIALAILAMSLVVLIRGTTLNVRKTEDAYMDGVVTELARGQMYEIEEKLAKDGFQETDDHQEDTFEKEGWEDIKYEYKVEAVELPDLGAMQEVAQGALGGSGSGSGPGSGSGSEMMGGGALAGMMSMFGGDMSASDAKGAAFIQQQYELVKQVLKASIRKVTLTVKWKVMDQARDLVIVEYVTDAAGMNKVLGGLGATEPTSTTPPSTRTPPGRGP